jgi:NAD(P)-dependent dehydrogenase (short-subunit alcohol dehydrogenase family)
MLIVGASAGIGAATACRAGAEGARLALVGRRADPLGALAASLAAHPIAADVSEAGQADRVVAEAVAVLGGLDALAVVAGPMGERGPFHQTTDEVWLDYHRHVLQPVVGCCRAALPHLTAAGGGAIVTVAAYSMHAQHADMAHYAAMKSAVASVTKNVAKSYGPLGVRANCIAPGVLVGPRADQLVEQYGGTPERAYYQHVAATYGMRVALERAGRPEEVADLITFLLSDRAAYLTGALINIDGGTDF